MKYHLIIIFFILFFSATVLSQPEQRAEQGKEKESEQKVQPPRKTEEGTQKPEEKDWPPPFVPSEQVGADSVISFPSDI